MIAQINFSKLAEKERDRIGNEVQVDNLGRSRNLLEHKHKGSKGKIKQKEYELDGN